MADCDYDGGDCCGDAVQGNYCAICMCYSEEVEEEIDPGKII
jgi:hypothetical protein